MLHGETVRSYLKCELEAHYKMKGIGEKRLLVSSTLKRSVVIVACHCWQVHAREIFSLRGRGWYLKNHKGKKKPPPATPGKPSKNESGAPNLF